MNTSIKISFAHCRTVPHLVHSCVQSLEAVNIHVDIIEDLELSSVTYDKGINIEDLIPLLENKKLDAVAVMLQELPLQLPEKITISGLSEREELKYALVVQPEFYSVSEDLKIKNGTNIGVDSALFAKQLIYLNPTIFCELLHQNELELWLQSGKLDNFGAILMEWSKAEIMVNKFNSLKLVPIHTREMIQLPGSGVIAFLCLTEDINSRKIINRIHHRSVSELTIWKDHYVNN